MQKKKNTHRQLFFAAVIGIVSLAVVYSLVAFSVTPVQYDFAVGEVAPATITASKPVVDSVSMQQAIDAARSAVAEDPPYMVDEGLSERVLSDIGAYFDGMADIPAALEEAYINAQVETNGGYYYQYARDYDPSMVDWQSFLSDGLKQDMLSALRSHDIPDAALYAAAAMTNEDVETMRSAVADSALAALSNGIKEEYLESAKEGVRGKLESLYEVTELSYLAMLPVDMYLLPNHIIDEAALAQQQDDAEAAVLPGDFGYIQGQTVVTAGDKVTAAQFAMLQELGVVGGQQTDYLLYISMFVYITLLFILYGGYLSQFERELLTDTRHLLMLATIAVVTAVLTAALARFDERYIAVFFGTMLACTLISQRNALVFTVFLAFTLSPAVSWHTGLFSTVSLTAIMASILGGAACVLALHRPMHRASLITAGLAAGAVGATVVILAQLIGASTFTMQTLAVSGAYALSSGLFSGVLAIGTLPLWEAVFRASTPAKLLELSNPNHPLLKRLTIEAPGTYHHSILTANLAEAGADAVGASSLLCRVGAYYHDIGKLKEPLYFAENQKGDNPHDLLDPRESAKIIAGHVAYGLELAHKYKLPREVLSIIAQHHGSTQIAFFYHKAIEAGIESKAAQFRYPGGRPQTREAAIVMLADCVEAAVRSMGDAGIEQAREMIGKLIRERYNDGQLDETPLSRQDLNRIAQAFTGVYEGALHERVKYPGQE